MNVRVPKLAFSLQFLHIIVYFCQECNYTIMTKLSVNINKIATIRNARGGNMPGSLTL